MFEEIDSNEKVDQKKFEAKLVGALKKIDVKGFDTEEYRFLRYYGEVDDAVRLAAFTSPVLKEKIIKDIDAFKKSGTYRQHIKALGNPAVTMELRRVIVAFNKAGEAVLIGIAREDSERRAKRLDIPAEVAKAEKQATRIANQNKRFSEGLEKYGSLLSILKDNSR